MSAAGSAAKAREVVEKIRGWVKEDPLGRLQDFKEWAGPYSDALEEVGGYEDELWLIRNAADLKDEKSLGLFKLKLNQRVVEPKMADAPVLTVPFVGLEIGSLIISLYLPGYLRVSSSGPYWREVDRPRFSIGELKERLVPWET